MIKRISKTEEIEARLKTQGTTIRFDKKEDIAEMQKVNSHLEEINRDFQIKEAKSEVSASKTILRD